MRVLDAQNLILEESSIHPRVFVTIIGGTIRLPILVLLVINGKVSETAAYLIQEGTRTRIEYF